MSHRERRLLWGVLAASVIARIIYYALGVRFSIDPLGYYLQILDPELLRHDLARSIFYLRDQPPLFNLFLGVVLKLFPTNYAAAFTVLYSGAGLILTALLYSLMVRMRIAPWLSAAVTLVFINSPITLLYENWLFYTFPLAVMLLASAFFLHRHLESGRSGDAAAFFFLLAALVLTRGIFHPLWMAPLVVAVIFVERGRRKRVALAALGPCLLVLAFTAKNYFVFHTLFTGRALQQMNLGTLTTEYLPAELRNRLIRENKLTPLANMSYASGLPAFRRYIPAPHSTGIPALDQPQKSTGYSNWNHSSYVDVGALYGRDADYTVLHYPLVYLEGMGHNLVHYMLPSDEVDPFNTRRNLNRKAMASELRVYDFIFAGQFNNETIPWFHWLGIPFLWIFAIAVGARGIKRYDATALTVLYIAYNLAVVTTVTIGLSYTDHNRFRFKLAPLYCVLLALALQRLLSWRRWRPGTSGTATSAA